MIDILYEDNHQLVVNKPAGILTQPSGTDQPNLESYAKDWIKKKYQKPGNVYLHTIHRLDKLVSGVVLFARTEKALSRLQETMRNKQCQKAYVALVEGRMSEQEGMLEHFLVHDDHRSYVSNKNNPEAKLARLHFKTLEIFSDHSLVMVLLDTGRYHQIRAQFSAIGFPILGDERYGSTRFFSENAIALHHQRLEIAHPTLHHQQVFEAPLPPYWPL